MKVRFWFYWNDSWVKLTLEAQEKNAIELYSYYPNDEGGGTATWKILWLENGIVYLNVERKSKDCDGVFSEYDLLSCPIAELGSRECYNTTPEYCPVPGAKLPNWRNEKSYQRDYTAEAMGY
jgi:hypothetical protein